MGQPVARWNLLEFPSPRHANRPHRSGPLFRRSREASQRDQRCIIAANRDGRLTWLPAYKKLSRLPIENRCPRDVQP